MASTGESTPIHGQEIRERRMATEARSRTDYDGEDAHAPSHCREVRSTGDDCSPQSRAIGAVDQGQGEGEVSSPSRPARRPWTAAEQNKLDDLLSAGKTAHEIATVLQRTPQAIYAQLHRLDVKRERSSRHPAREWNSMKSDRELLALAKTHSLQAIADKLKRPPESILRKAAKLGASISGKAKAKK
jgi:hypothetical protein